MSWLQKLLPPRIKATPGVNKKSMPEGLWVKCPACEAVLYRTDLEKNLNVCPKCGHHARINARERIEQLLDPEARYEIGSEVVPVDSLKFKDTRKYPDRLVAALEETGETDALVVMQGSIKSVPWCSPCSSSTSWAGRWARSSANASCAACASHTRTRCPSSASRRAAVRACRKG